MKADLKPAILYQNDDSLDAWHLKNQIDILIIFTILYLTIIFTGKRNALLPMCVMIFQTYYGQY
jgi:hypothetical protein